MELWTITEAFAGRYQLRIQFGGRPYWCMFDYAVTPDSKVDGVETVLTDGADSVSAHWFPHLKRGVAQGLAESEERGRKLIRVRVTVQKVHEHPIDTTPEACERYGRSFADGLVWARAVPAG